MMTTSVIIIKCILFLITTSIDNAHNTCKTPYNRPGLCVWIEDCPPINDIAKNPRRTHSQSRLIADSHCVTEIINGIPKLKVCCTADDAKLGCRLPEFPDKGSYEIDGIDIKVGAHVPAYTVLTYKCENNYKPHPQDAVYCQKNLMWDQNITCVKQITNSRIAKDFSEHTEPNLNQNVTKTSTEIPIIHKNSDDLLPTICDKENSGRIFNGYHHKSRIDRYPWMALIKYRTPQNKMKFFCGASLINDRYLITSAHCVVGEILQNVGTPTSVLLGKHDPSKTKECGTRGFTDYSCKDTAVSINIESITAHPDFKPSTSSEMKNDVALIRIIESAPKTADITPICLPRHDITENLESKSINFTLSGWNTTVTDMPKSKNPKYYLDLPFIELTECQRIYNNSQFSAQLWDKQLCAGGKYGTKSCEIILGSPLTYNEDENIYLFGVRSFGVTLCDTHEIPDVFTNVYKYIDWIKSSLQP